MFFFFFSSRRRHTRYWRDWSSDVCSSDLYTLQYDDVMNQQRTVIYSWRNDILTTETPREELFAVVEEVLEGETEARLTGPEASPAEFVTWLNGTFPLGAEEKDFNFSAGPEAV